LPGIGGAAHHPVIPGAVGVPPYRYGILVVHLSGISKLPGSYGLQIGAKTTVNLCVSPPAAGNFKFAARTLRCGAKYYSLSVFAQLKLTTKTFFV